MIKIFLYIIGISMATVGVLDTPCSKELKLIGMGSVVCAFVLGVEFLARGIKPE